MKNDTDRQAETESRRILDRVSGAAGTLGGGGMKPRGEGEEDDRIEYWGTRIGRTLGLIIAVFIIAYLVLSILHGE